MLATFCGITEHSLKIICYYTCVSLQEYNNRYQKEVFATQSKHTTSPLWNKPHSSNTFYVSLSCQMSRKARKNVKKHLILRQLCFLRVA